MSLLANSNAIESGGYNIDRSLRFRSSASAYLNRTPASASNRKTFTWSGWVKIGDLATGSSFLLFSSGNGTTSNYFRVEVTTSQIRIININSSAVSGETITIGVYRDPSAWYHIVAAVDTTNATAADRFIIYVNGVRASVTNPTTVTLNSDTWVNSANAHYFGRQSYSASGYFDGYLAEVNFIDGQALTPSSFGQTDPVTGVWTPKKYAGTYGTNGFYLPFSDNTSATTLAYDKSGNGNNWTPNNISTTAGATYDSMTDVPTLTSATAANFATLNPLQSGSNMSLGDGNLKFTFTGSGSAFSNSRSTIAPSSGKWYVEMVPNETARSKHLGFTAITDNVSLTADLGINTNMGANSAAVIAGGATQSGNVYLTKNGTTTQFGTYAASDIFMAAIDVDSGKMWFGKNGTWLNSGDPVNGTSPWFTGTAGTTYQVYLHIGDGGTSSNGQFGYANFGQRPFSYTPPTGFKALNTFNLPDPTIKKPNQYMDATIYTSTGTTQTITNAGGFQPDFVWQKARSNVQSHYLTDSVRGVTKYLSSNSTAAEATDATWITSLNSNGVTFGTGNLANGWTNVIWQWKKGATPGFDIVTYTGTGSARTVAHSLGVAPKMVIVKRRDSTQNWPVYHANLTSATYSLFLDLTAAQGSYPTIWNSTAPTSSVFSVGTIADVNANGGSYVAYLFAEIAGFSRFGTWQNNNSTDGAFIYLGFRPAMILLKNSDNVESWYIWDAKRFAYNVAPPAGPLWLSPNSSAAENSTNTSTVEIDALSNGFKIRTTNPAAGEISFGTRNYIYAAFADVPQKFSLAR